MIAFRLAGLDWLWLALWAALFWASAAVPVWMHGRATSADAYENGWFDRDQCKPLRPYFAGWRALLGGRHSRLRLWAEWRWPQVHTPPTRQLPREREWAEITALLPPVKDQWAGWSSEKARAVCLEAEREWAESTADWMRPASRAELAAWVQGMMVSKS